MVRVRHIVPALREKQVPITFTLAAPDPRPQQLSLRSAYRQLLRTSLQAVRFATPARYQIRSILREAFRNSPRIAFNQRRIRNTLAFLEQAREHNGFEHKILRNILHVRFWRDHPKKDRLPPTMKQNNEVGVDLRRNVPGQFDATLTLFNESTDMCLRV